MFTCIFNCLDQHYPENIDPSEQHWTTEQIISCQHACSSGDKHEMTQSECNNMCTARDDSYELDVGDGIKIVSSSCGTICNEYPTIVNNMYNNDIQSCHSMCKQRDGIAELTTDQGVVLVGDSCDTLCLAMGNGMSDVSKNVYEPSALLSIYMS